MAKQNLKQPVLASLLDRLIDETPNRRTASSSRSRAQQLTILCQSVRRDLEKLLNTRQRCISWPDEWTALNTSLVDYGIADFMGSGLDTEAAQQAFCIKLTEIIQRYDPRFKEIEVLLSNTEEEVITRTLRLRIKGLLHAEPVPEPIILDSILEPDSRTFTVVDITS
jgi:type VI secretion system protein ImpF